MSKVFMTDKEKSIVDSVLDENKFWVYGKEEACFRDDAISMIVQALKELKEMPDEELMKFLNRENNENVSAYRKEGRH